MGLQVALDRPGLEIRGTPSGRIRRPHAPVRDAFEQGLSRGDGCQNEWHTRRHCAFDMRNGGWHEHGAVASIADMSFDSLPEGSDSRWISVESWPKKLSAICRRSGRRRGGGWLAGRYGRVDDQPDAGRTEVNSGAVVAGGRSSGDGTCPDASEFVGGWPVRVELSRPRDLGSR